MPHFEMYQYQQRVNAKKRLARQAPDVQRTAKGDLRGFSRASSSIFIGRSIRRTARTAAPTASPI